MRRSLRGKESHDDDVLVGRQPKSHYSEALACWNEWTEPPARALGAAICHRSGLSKPLGHCATGEPSGEPRGAKSRLDPCLETKTSLAGCQPSAGPPWTMAGSLASGRIDWASTSEDPHLLFPNARASPRPIRPAVTQRPSLETSSLDGMRERVGDNAD